MEDESLEKQSLEKTIRRKILPRSLFLVFSLSVVLIFIATMFVQGQIDKRHMAYAEEFVLDFNESLASLQQQVNNLAKNDLIINSIVDDSNRDAYLPVFFRSLELTITDNVSILFTDFSGEIITGKNTQLYLSNRHKFDWQPSVLERASRYLHYSESGIMVAAPILYSNSAEGAIVTYVKNLQAAVKRTSGNHLIILINEKGRVLFSSDQSEVAQGSAFTNFNAARWFMLKKTFGANQVISLEPLISAYSDMFWLVSFMCMALIAVVIGSLYSTRLSSKMASDMLGELQRSISVVSSGTGFHANSQPIENEPKEFEAIRKSYDDALRDLDRTTISLGRFENVINSLDEVLMVIDSEGSVILNNSSLDKFLGVVGYTLPNDLEKILPLDFINTSNHETSVLECIYQHSSERSGEQEQFCEIKWIRNDYLNEHGHLLGAVVIGTNITASKRLASELLIKNKAIDEAHTSIIISDALQKDFPITYVNEAFEKLTGYSSEEVLKHNCRFLQGKDSDENVIIEINKALSNNQPITVTILNYKKDGTAFYNQLTLNPIFNDKGVVTHILGLQSDVTEQEKATRYTQQAQIKAEESAKLKSNFLASMSHEIRTPMNGIMGMLSLLLGSQLNTEQKHHASLAKSSSESLLTIINDILDFSKIEAGKLDIEPIEFNLVSHLRETIESIIGKAEEKGVEVILDVSNITTQYVLGDPGRIRQILINLLGNAIKFTDNGSIIVCAMLENQTDHLLFTCSVQDHGIGIEQDRLAHIFDSFTQADASTTRKFGGTGLGLAICKQLVELMEGSISIDSTPGLGSTFSFNITLGKASINQNSVDQRAIEKESASNFNNSESDHTNTGKGILPQALVVDEEAKILLAEDNYTNQVLAEALLKNMGYSVDIVENGEQALLALNETSATKKYELILMDCQMPIMDGFETTHKIRKGDGGDVYKNMPIIAMTANAIKGDKEYCLSIGMSDYISKPIDPSILHEKLTMWLPVLEQEGKAAVEPKIPSNSSIDTSKCWDQEEFLLRLSGNERVFHKVISVFLKDMPILIDQLENAIRQHDFDKIQGIAHTLKGCSANISAHALADAALEIELGAKEVSTNKLDSLWSKFLAEKDTLCRQLQAFK